MAEFDIAHWLESIGMEKYAEAFREHDIDAETLTHLTDADLKEIGITSLGHRRKVVVEIQRLRHESLSAVKAEAEPKITVPTNARPASAVVSAPKDVPTPPRVPEPKPSTKLELPTKQPASLIPSPTALLPQTEPSRESETSAATKAAEATQSPSAKPKDAPERKTFWKRIIASKFLFGSIVAHLIFGIGATFFIVQRYSEKRKVTFAGGPPATTASTRALEHKISMAQKKKTGGAPPQAKRIASTGLGALTLPDLPTTSTANTVVPGMAAGMGGAGMGMGMGFGSGMGSGMGGGGGGGSGLTMFGFRGGGVGLTGTFYDYKRRSDGSPSGKQKEDRPAYTAILQSFLNGWKPSESHPHHVSTVKLGAKAFFFPCIPDTEAGKAFQDKDAGPGLWLAHYTGTVTPNVSGEYRFVAFGDNVMMTGINGKLVLDASDIGYIRPGRTVVGQATFPDNGGKPIFEGDWFQITAGTSFKMDVLIGDEGGVFGAGLFLQKKGDHYHFGKSGLPQLPLALFAPLTETEKSNYRKYLSDTSFNGPVFRTTGGSGSLFAR